MWNALNGIGGAGLVNAGPANEMNIALYTTFTIAGFFGGIAIAKLGVRLSFIIGLFGYSLYSSRLLAYKHISSRSFLLVAGVQLGISAGWFWTAQAFTVTTYPSREGEGKALSRFNLIYDLGACIGSLISFLRNRNSSFGEVDDISFYAIISLSIFGALLATMICNPREVSKSDKTPVTLPQSPTWRDATIGLWKCLLQEWQILFLFPMFFASNYYYPYQVNTFNLANFTIRTRSLNNILYWLCEIVGSFAFGYVLDNKLFGSKLTRARMALLVLFILICGIWSCALLWQQRVAVSTGEHGKIDYSHSSYHLTIVLYMAFGFLAAGYQNVLYWYLSAICIDDERRSHLGGFYKGMQSAGAAVDYHLNTTGFATVTELAVNWGILAGGILIAAPVIFTRVQNDDDPALIQEARTAIA